MGAELIIGSLELDSGTKQLEVLPVPIGGQTVEVPVIAINGERDGPRVTITAGIHPAEYVGVEAARRLGLALEAAEVSGSLVIVPICNTSGFFARSIYTSALDDQNLNRVFPGNREGAPSEALAAWLFDTIIRPSQYYVDLHGGDMIEALEPFVLYLRSGDAVEETSREMALATGIPRIASGVVAGGTYGAAAQAGIPGILNEVGGQGVWDDALVDQYVEHVRGVLRYLHVLPGEQPLQTGQREYASFTSVRASASGLWYPAVRGGETVKTGQVLGQVRDYFGENRQSVQAPVAGDISFLVTSLAMNEGDPLLGIVSP